jgi:hypothetical protein
MAVKVLLAPVTVTMSTRVTRIIAHLVTVTVTTGTKAIAIAGAAAWQTAAAAVVAALTPIGGGTKRRTPFRLLLTFSQLHSGVDG